MALRGCVEPLESVGRTSKTVGRYSYLFLVAEKRGQERSTSFHWINLTCNVVNLKYYVIGYASNPLNIDDPSVAVG